jgi:hypothetical protein
MREGTRRDADTARHKQALPWRRPERLLGADEVSYANLASADRATMESFEYYGPLCCP